MRIVLNYILPIVLSASFSFFILFLNSVSGNSFLINIAAILIFIFSGWAIMFQDAPICKFALMLLALIEFFYFCLILFILSTGPAFFGLENLEPLTKYLETQDLFVKYIDIILLSMFGDVLLKKRIADVPVLNTIVDSVSHGLSSP